MLFSTTSSSQRFILYFFHNRNSRCGRHIVNFCGSISEDVDDEISATEYTFTNSDFQLQKLRDENNSSCIRIRLSSSPQFTWYWYIPVVLFSQFWDTTDCKIAGERDVLSITSHLEPYATFGSTVLSGCIYTCYLVNFCTEKFNNGLCSHFSWLRELKG